MLILPCPGNCFALDSSTRFHKLAILLVTCFLAPTGGAGGGLATLLLERRAGLGIPVVLFKAPFGGVLDSFLRL